VLLEDHENAIVPPSKLRDYLLNLDHKKGGSKAVIFTRIGFRREAWERLEGAFRALIAHHDAIDLQHEGEPRFGVEGVITGPDGEAYIRTVWGYPQPGSPPVLRTAYPKRRPRI